MQNKNPRAVDLEEICKDATLPYWRIHRAVIDLTHDYPDDFKPIQ